MVDMKNYKAIPKGHMTVGELAKKVNVTVRTLQYYDKEGLLESSAASEGRRRLYTDMDMVRLQQILPLEYLGFSLEDTINCLILLDNPNNMVQVLAEQATVVTQQINTLTEALTALEALQAEVIQMQTVDFNKYAEIIEILKCGSEHYWVPIHFDDKLMFHIKDRFTEESAKELTQTLQNLCEEAIFSQLSKVTPESEQGHAFAKQCWDMVIDFASGDMNLIPGLEKFANSRHNWNNDLKGKLGAAEPFMKKVVKTYLSSQNILAEAK